ncbi:MAG: energy-coupling factor transporter ATPase [Clostridiales bacterium]|nr:energy-coupling factor transporter ATPase [Clostridiales bacterium]
MPFITAKNLKHYFVRRDEEGQVTGEIPALDGIDLEVEPGQFIAVLGHNGSGKSTFAKHLNVLLSPTEGTLFVDGKNVDDEEETWNIRQSAGMIFQNPDNQIVAGVVEEDVAFGPENIGVPTEEIVTRVEESLAAVDMTDYRHHSPNKLSGGQKQRVAVAGVVAMRPKCIIMDEPTAMLDPNGRQEVLKTAHRLNREEGVTIILITHYMEEAADADFIFVLDQGKVVMRGTPQKIFSEADELHRYGLDVPQITRLACELKKEGCPLPDGILNRAQLVEALCGQVLPPGSRRDADVRCKDTSAEKSDLTKENAILTRSDRKDRTSVSDEKDNINEKRSENEYDLQDRNLLSNIQKKEKLRMEQVSYAYGAGTAYERQALKNVSLSVYDGDFIGIIGHTGSGKSTLIQLFNGLLKTKTGKICFEGQDISAADFSMHALRGRVGMVFQYPEYQLFETTVLKDVAFGPKNLGLNEAAAAEKAKTALRQVKLSEDCWEMSPFELSGGQKRRAAIAGVIAMEPEVLILDEPTAGMDPQGRDELFRLIRELHDGLDMTVLLVSHSMEDVADYVDRIIVMNQGEIMLDGIPSEVFTHVRELEEASLAVPQVTYFLTELRERGYPVNNSVTTLEEAKKEILKLC